VSTYRFFFTQTASTSVEVEGDDYESALEEAWNNTPGSLCHQCAGHFEMSGEWEPDESCHYLNGEYVERALSGGAS
jgi:hypothetical protein